MRSLQRRAAAIVAWALALTACAPLPSDEDLVDEGRSPIIGGVEEHGFPLVGMLAIDTGGGMLYPFCTATPVTPTVLITAAHCTDAARDDYAGHPILYARFSPGGTGPMHRVNVGSIRAHPQWGMWDPNYINDISVVRLDDAIDADLFPEQHRTPLSGGDVGTRLKVVGFGVSSAPDVGAGTKRSIDMSITEARNQYFVMALSESWRGVCYGDSGGPSFLLGTHRNVQVGVHARTQVESCGPAEDTTVGYFFDSFVRPAVLALDSTAETCGDGICTGLEIEATCGVDCSPYVCGDGLREGPEVCDDGNVIGGDGCSADCLSSEVCGNGITDLAAGEVCDDGNAMGGDGCSADCWSNETCGNGITDLAAGEVCDDGNAMGGDGCSADCRSDETCGNGVIDFEAGEQCDDGNLLGADGCSADCRSNETCGNGVSDDLIGEACDDGNTVSGDGCSGDCRVAEGCGNGVLEAHFGEVCDDGNLSSGDGCSANCRSDETCGNGLFDEAAGETCDDGNVLDGDGCPFDCGVPTGPMPALRGGCSCRTAAPRPASSWVRSLVPLLG